MDNRLVLFKNRDRAYDVNLKIYHLASHGTETAVIFDLDSGYCEGLNEHGLGIVNTALMVLRDEQEGKGKGKEPSRSKDGPRIFSALRHDNINDAMRTLLQGDPIKGHTFIAQGDALFCIESSRTHKPRVHQLECDRINTRTNHGITYPDAGYTQGEDYVSSVVRRWEAQKRFQTLTQPEDMARALYEPICNANSPFNPVRDTKKMRTTSQVLLDLERLVLHLYLVPGHCVFKGVKNYLDRKPRIDVKVWSYSSEKNRFNLQGKHVGRLR